MGMLRLRRSVKVATASAMSVDHQANECIPMLLPLGFRGVVILELAIVQPNRRRPKQPQFGLFTACCPRPVYTDVYGRFPAVKRGVYIPQAPPARGLGGAASDSLKK